MATYLIRFRFDLGQAIEPVGELANELNTHLARMGYDEKLAITSELPALSLQVNRDLTPNEMVTVKSLIEQQFQSAFSKWNVRLVDFYRKSGNVEQSVSQ